MCDIGVCNTRVEMQPQVFWKEGPPAAECCGKVSNSADKACCAGVGGCAARGSAVGRPRAAPQEVPPSAARGLCRKMFQQGGRDRPPEGCAVGRPRAVPRDVRTKGAAIGRPRAVPSAARGLCRKRFRRRSPEGCAARGSAVGRPRVAQRTRRPPPRPCLRAEALGPTARGGRLRGRPNQYKSRGPNKRAEVLGAPKGGVGKGGVGARV